MLSSTGYSHILHKENERTADFRQWRDDAIWRITSWLTSKKMRNHIQTKINH